jgi:hypothetical protein
MNDRDQSAAEYARQFDLEWDKVIEPIIDEMDRARCVEPDDQAEECIDLEEEMQLSQQRRRAG